MLSSAFIDFNSYIVLFAATTCVFMLFNNLNIYNGNTNTTQIATIRNSSNFKTTVPNGNYITTFTNYYSRRLHITTDLQTRTGTDITLTTRPYYTDILRT